MSAGPAAFCHTVEPSASFDFDFFFPPTSADPVLLVSVACCAAKSVFRLQQVSDPVTHSNSLLVKTKLFCKVRRTSDKIGTHYNYPRSRPELWLAG